jgi:hypothetical protein
VSDEKLRLTIIVPLNVEIGMTPKEPEPVRIFVPSLNMREEDCTSFPFQFAMKSTFVPVVKADSNPSL